MATASSQPFTRREPSSSWAHLSGALAGLVVLGVGIHLLDPAHAAGAQNFVLIFSSILIEAVPFVLIGAIASAVIEVFVPASLFERLARLPKPIQLPAAGLAGLAFPVCECGSVPVARRLVSKGLAPGAAVTFMLAAPILNPVVLASTIVAYRGRSILWPMVLGRAGMGLAIAIAVGWVASGYTAQDLLRHAPRDLAAGAVAGGHEPRWSAFFSHLSGDFVFMARFLMLGAAVAAALQTLVPQSVIGSVASTPILDLVAMMGLAFLLSLCSESDAFVAASFVQFGAGAQLAFLVFGPMVDTKLGFLYTGVFSARFFRNVVIVVTLLTLAGTLWFQVAFG
ncbi:MAG: permease [Actinomycetota bacterium]|nr:permease [Actinomycetota bacterium]